jgi:hypothetical protein
VTNRVEATMHFLPVGLAKAHRLRQDFFFDALKAV